MKNTPLRSALAAFAALPILSAPASTGVSPAGVFLPVDLTDVHPGVAYAPDVYSTFGAANAFDDETSTTAGRWLSTFTDEQFDRSEIGELRWTFSDGPQVVADPRFARHRHRGPLNRSSP